MPDTKEISALTTAESTSASDLFETALPNAMTETGYISRKVTLNTIATFILNTLKFQTLNTTVKNIIGAINELAQGSGQSLDTLNDVDIDAQTLTDGQGIVYDATAQKWKNGAVSGGGHTYSTTEQVVSTWIDGSPVYEIVLETDTQVQLNNTSWTTIPWNNEPSDIDLLISAEIVRVCPNTNFTLRFTLDGGHIKGASLVESNYPPASNLTERLIIRYTKSST
jgi:hypothetical protein